MDFQTIPATVLQPLFYAEVSNRKAAAPGAVSRPTLIVGQKVTSGTATANALIRITGGAAQAQTLGGVGSQFARTVAAYIANDPLADIYGICLADNGSTKAEGTLTITGTATETRPISLYIAGQLLTIPVTSGEAATTVGARLEALLGVNEAAAVTLGSPYPVTAANTGGAVVLTARNAGTMGNRIDIRINYLGEPNEALPAGIAITELPAGTRYKCLNALTTPTTGATDPVHTSAITAAANRRFGAIVLANNDATALTAWKAELADTTSGRWGPIRQQYGKLYCADVSTYADLSGSGFATSIKNDPHAAGAAIVASPTPPWEIAGAYAGRCMARYRNDPARPCNYLTLTGVKAPHADNLSSWTEREVLMGLGISVLGSTDSGEVQILRDVSTYIKNGAGGADASYRDGTTTATLETLLTEMRTFVLTNYADVKIVDDGTYIAPGAAVTTPRSIHSDIVALARGWERRGLIENIDTFASLLVVERDSTDATRVNVYFRPDLANGLMVFSALAEFALQYTEGEIAA